MGQPYVGEIRIFAGTFAPNGWLFCQGQQLSIAENEVLFQLIGTTYGGDGQETFNIPDLTGRIPMHMGTAPSGITYPISQRAGTSSETLTNQQMPAHNHAGALLADSRPGNVREAARNLPSLEGSGQNAFFAPASGTSTMAATQLVSPYGGSQPHDNMPPYLAINFIISLFGIFPSPT